MKRKVLKFLLYFIPGVLIAGVLAFNIFRPIQVLPRIGLGPGFGLDDLNGERVTNETLRGKIVLYSFTYTHCEADCPQLMEKMVEVWQRLDEVELGEMEVDLVTISIDPERDTREVMAQYASDLGVPTEFEAGQPTWHFLTGDDPTAVKIMVSTGFDLFYEKEVVETNTSNAEPAAYRYEFMPMAVLEDGWGLIRSEYRQYEPSERLSFSDGASDIDPDILLRDIGLVAAEANNSTGMSSAAYGAAHLFLCYPP
jgi:cytochrome oxidase Cu insertion factor (SCO1/SenC/PrrC family)